MEGWDGTADGEPSDLTRRRWQRFGLSGAKLIWGGEAVAVQHDGRANPNQLVLDARTQPAIAGAARDARRGAPRARSAPTPTAISSPACSSRTPAATPSRRSTRRPEPLTAYAHPHLDRRFPAGVRMLTDDDLDRLVERFVVSGEARVGRGLRVRGREALPRLPRARAAQRAAAAGTLRRHRSRTARASSARSSTASAPRFPACASSSGCRRSTWCRSGRASRASAYRKSPRRRTDRRSASSTARHEDLDAALADARALLSLLERHRRALGLHHGGQPVLQPAHAAAGAVSAERRLSAARGSAGRRRAADCRDGEPEEGLPVAGDRRARPTATCRSGCRTSRSTTSATA